MGWFHGSSASRTAAGPAVEAIMTPGSPSAGLVLVADGIGGMDLCGRALARVVTRAELPYTTWVVHWCHGYGRWYADLTRYADCEARADDVAETIRLFRDRRPDVPVFLVGKSGGCAVMIKALERIETPLVERAVLLAPALSPGYDLAPALQNVNRDIVVHWSPYDLFFLGLGTGVFGTSDRIRGRGAGLVGFRLPGADDDPSRQEAYRKLRQVRWTPSMSLTGYFGGHLGPDSPRFLAKYIVPLLRVERAAEA